MDESGSVSKNMFAIANAAFQNDGSDKSKFLRD